MLFCCTFGTCPEVAVSVSRHLLMTSCQSRVHLNHISRNHIDARGSTSACNGSRISPHPTLWTLHLIFHFIFSLYRGPTLLTIVVSKIITWTTMMMQMILRCIFPWLHKTQNATLKKPVQWLNTVIHHWMTENIVKLNDNTWFPDNWYTETARQMWLHFRTSILSQTNSSSTSARKLGAIFDINFSFIQYITNTCRSWLFFHIGDRPSRRCLSLYVTKTIATPLVSSILY